MSTCLLCQGEKLPTLTFCDSICKDVYAWIEKGTKREREEEEGVNFTAVLPPELSYHILYQVPLLRLHKMSTVNFALRSVYNDMAFRKLYVQYNASRFEDMLEVVWADDRMRIFFQWAGAAYQTGMVIKRFADRLDTLFFNYIEVMPQHPRLFEEFVPLALSYEMWSNQVNNGRLLEAIQFNLYVQGAGIVLGYFQHYPGDYLPSAEIAEENFRSITEKMFNRRRNPAFAPFMNDASLILDMLLETGRVTFTQFGLEILNELILLEFANVLDKALYHAKAPDVVEALGSRVERKKMLLNAAKSRNEKSVMVLLRRRDWDFLDCVEWDVVSQLINKGYKIALKEAFEEAPPERVAFEENAELYLQLALDADHPDIALYYLLNQPNFPTLDGLTRKGMLDQIEEKIRQLTTYNTMAPSSPMKVIQEQVRLYRKIADIIKKNGLH